MKKALVTGAAGFIGSHVVRELLRENIAVRALIRPGESTANLEGLDVELVTGDILDRPAVDRAMEGVDGLFHLAAIYSIWMQDWRHIYEINLQGSRNVLWSAVSKGVERVVYTSSIAGIGLEPGMGVSTENTPFNQYALGNHYVLTKYLSQQEALSFAHNGLDLVVVNPAFPFGPNDIGPTPTGKLILDVVQGQNRFYFDGGINIIDVRDVARGHILAAQRGRRGELYILGNQNVTLDQFFTLVCAAANLDKSRLFKTPVQLAKTVGWFFAWWSNNVSHRPPLSTDVEVTYSSNYLFFDNSKARQELGLTFTPMETALADALEWFRTNGYIQ